MKHFSITLCLGTTRSREGDIYDIRHECGVSLGNILLNVDAVVLCALPSKTAGALLRSIQDTPDFSHSVHILLVSNSQYQRVGDTVVEHLLHMQHPSHSDFSASYTLMDCLLVASDGNVVICKSIRATEPWKAIKCTLDGLAGVSLIVFKYACKSAVLLIGSQLTTSYLASLLLASRRNVFLYMNESNSTEEVVTCIREINDVRKSLVWFLKPLPPPRLMSSECSECPWDETALSNLSGSSVVGPGVSRVLDALARSDEEYIALVSAINATEGPQKRTCAIVDAQGEQNDLADVLARERLLHCQKMERLHVQLSHAQREKAGTETSPPLADSVSPEEESTVPGHRADERIALLQREVAALRHSLQETEQKKRLAEEKACLLEFRNSLRDIPMGGPSHPIPLSSQLQQRSQTSSSSQQVGEQRLLMHLRALEKENHDLIAELQHKEREWQVLLQEAKAEVALALATRREMESTLLLQSRTIAEAKKMTTHANASFSSSANAVQLIAAQRGRKVYRVRGQNFDIEDTYTLTSIVGQGSYGVVCAALDNHTYQEVAIKRVSRVFEDLVDGRRIWREIFILRLLKEKGCRNILNLLRVLQPKSPITEFRDLYMVTDLYDIDFLSIIRQQEEKSVDMLRILTARVLRCLADMHSMGMIHRDIKPSNILLRADKGAESAIICDFGLARAGLHSLEAPLDLTDYVVTRWYRAPELLLMCSYSFPIDLWAVGCVIAEYIMQRPLFAGRDYIHQLQLVVSSIPITGTAFIEATSASAIPHLNEVAKKYKNGRPLSHLLSALPREALDLVTQMLAFEPENRITARGALRHRFFESVGGEDCSSYPSPPNIDLGFDMHAEISEYQLRRAIWNEVEYYRENQMVSGLSSAKENDNALKKASHELR